MCEPKYRPFKVWDKERIVTKGFTVSSFQELKNKGCKKLQIDPPVTVVLAEDGTEIDEEYFSFLPDNTVFMLLPGRSEWMPPHSSITSYDHPDGAVLECGRKDCDLSSVIEKIKVDLACVVLLNEDEMHQFVDADTEGLAQILGRSTKVIISLQESCQRLIDEQADVKDLLELICFYNESIGSLGSWNPLTISTMKRDTNLFKNAFGDFRGRTLLIGSMEAKPFIFKKFRGNETVYEGFCITILQELAVRLNFSYKIIEPPDQLWGAPVGNGSWNGLIGMVMRGEINFVIGPLSITSTRAAVIDFTTPYMEDGSGILTKKPDPDADTLSGFFRLFKAMKPIVWACLCASVIGISIVIYLVNRWSPYSERNRPKLDSSPAMPFFNSFWASLGSMLGQGSEYQPKSSSGRIILGFWWLFTIILVSTYTANMTAVLTITIREQPINSIVELASQSQVKPLVKLGTNLYTLFQEAKDSIYITIWKMMSSDGVKATTNAEALSLVRTGKYAFITDRSQLEYIVKTDCVTYALADDVFNTAGMGFVLPKNAEFLTSVDVIIMKLKESGIIDGWKRQWWTGAGSKCSDADRVSTVSQLDLKYLAGPFIVFLTAMVLSVIVALVERSYVAYRRETTTE